MSQAGIVSLESSNPDIPVLFETDSGDAVASGGVLRVVGGAGITTTGSGNTITISSSASGFSWVSVTSADNTVQIMPRTAYSCDGVSQVVFLLPLVPSFGDEFLIISNTSTFRINQNGGQKIGIGNQSTTPGSGFVNSNSAGDYITCVYLNGNVFRSFAPQGTLTVN